MVDSPLGDPAPISDEDHNLRVWSSVRCRCQIRQLDLDTAHNLSHCVLMEEHQGGVLCHDPAAGKNHYLLLSNRGYLAQIGARRG